MGEGKIKKFYAIGDVHGCLLHLERLMENLASSLNPEEDTVVFLGDYIDRGPDPKGVVDYILQLQKKFHHIVCLKGNHEELFLDWLLNGQNYELFIYNGGGSTMQSYTRSGTFHVPPEHLSFFTSLRMYCETDDYIFVHAGLRQEVPLSAQDPHEMLWIRDEFIYTPHNLGKLVIFGHTPQHQVFMGPDKIGIDTGAVYGGKLTCLELPAKQYYSVGPGDLL